MSFGLMKKSSLLSGSTTLIQNHDGHVNAGRPSDRAMDSARIRHEVLAGAKAAVLGIPRRGAVADNAIPVSVQAMKCP